MVDDVHIVGSDLPAWATEQTLTNMVNAIKDLKNLTASQGASVRDSLSKMATGKGNDQTDALSEMERIFANNKAGTNESVGNVYNNLKDVASDLGQTSVKSKIYNSVIDNGEAVMFKFGKSIGLSSKAFGSLETATMVLVGKFIDLTIGGIQASIGMYMELYKSGILYNNMVGSATHGLGVLGQAASNAGVPVLMMGDLLKRFNTTMLRYGVEGFGIIAQKTQALGATLGLSASESAEALAEYMDNQRKAGALNTMTMEQVQKNAMIQMRTTMDFAREMGTTVDVLKESQSKIMDTTSFKVGLATIPAEIRAKMGGIASQILAMFDVKGMGDIGEEIMQVMAKGQLARGDKIMTDLMSLGPKGALAAEQIMELGESFKNGSITQEEMMKKSQGVMATLGSMNAEGGIAEFATKLGMAGNNVDYLITAAAAAAEAQNDIKNGRVNYDDEIAKSMSNMQSVWDRFTNIFSEIGAKLLKNPDFMIAFEKVVGYISEQMVRLVPIIVDNMPMIIDFVGKAVKGMVDFIQEIVSGKSVFSDLKSWIETAGIMFGVLFIGLGNIVTVLGWAWKGIMLLGSGLMEAYATINVIVGMMGTSIAALVGGLMLGVGIIAGIWEGLEQFDSSQILLSIANIFVQIGNVLIRAAGELYYIIKEALASNFGSALGLNEETVKKERADFANTYSSQNNTLVPSGIEKEKNKEQVITATATQEAKAEEKIKEKEKAKTAVKDTSKSKAATDNDVYQSNEANNKINKSILDATKYTNTLLETLNNHLASIEKNTKAESNAGAWK